MPARRPAGVRVKKRNCFGSCKVSSPRRVSRCAIRVTFVIPSPPAGPVPARMTLRTSCGSSAAISWAIMPPIEKPRRSTCSRPSARMKATASLRHRLDGVGRGAARGADAPVVEGDDPVLRGDAVDDSGVPVVQDGGQVGEEDHRDAGRRAELAVGEVDTADRDRAGRRGRVRRDHVAACLPGRTSSSWRSSGAPRY